MPGFSTDPYSAAGAALLVLAAAGCLCLFQVARDRRQFGTVGAVGAWLIWSVYLSFTALATCIAWAGVWPLPLEPWAAWSLGGAALLGGLALLAGGAWEFGSLGRMSGRANGRLIQSGIYRWTRNPQNLGWGSALVGVALLGGSGAALGLAAFFAIAFYLYCPVEERFLSGVYGEEWERYKASTHRFFGLPKQAPNRRAATGSPRWLTTRDPDLG